MENCEYKKIFTDTGIEINEYDNNTWKPLMRQGIITSGVCCVYFVHGLFLGAPTVLVAQIRRDVNSTEIITDEMLSWITTTPMISAVPFIIILPLLFNSIGRKLTFLFVWSIVLIGFIIFYNSTNLYQILIGEVCAGATTACTITISPVIIAEYTSPKYRGIFSNLKGASVFWGIWASNAIGTFFHWKNIAIVSFVCSGHMISMIVWPESPYWLAKRGQYTECTKTYRWLRGTNENSERELAQLLSAQKNTNHRHITSGNDNNGFCIISTLSEIWSIVTLQSFYKPTILSVLLIAQIHLTGKIVISMYAIELLKHLTPDESFVYKEMLILDGVTVFSMYLGCIITRYFKRRTLLLLFTGTGILLLYVLSMYLYLDFLSVLVKNDVLIILLLSTFSIAIGSGPMILSASIYGEIIPPRYQNLSMTFVGLGGVTVMSLLLKISPFMFKTFKMHGSFLFYAITSSILCIILYIYLPETKDKTIYEIEKYFTTNQVLVEKDKVKVHREVELNNLEV